MTTSNFYFECPPPSPKGVLDQKIERIYLELTADCNSRCPGCLNEAFIKDFTSRQKRSTFHSPNLNLTDWQNIIHTLPESVKTVILSGGEPTLSPYFLPVINLLKEKNIRIVIFSNGRWKHTDKLIDALKSLSDIRFLISLHGCTSSSHDTFVNTSGAFIETCENIKRATRSGIRVSISTVLTQQNFDEIENMPVLAMQLGAVALAFNRYLYTPDRVLSSEKSLGMLTPQQLYNVVKRIEILKLKYDNKLHIGYGPTIPQCFEESSSQACGAGFNSFVVDPWGNVRPCLHTALQLGNLKDQTFDYILENPHLHKWQHLTDEKCNDCSLQSKCGGGCRAMAYSWGGDTDPLYSKSSSSIPLPILIDNHNNTTLVTSPKLN